MGEKRGKAKYERDIGFVAFQRVFSLLNFQMWNAADKVKGIFGIEIHISLKCMILQIFSNYIINFEICKIGFSKPYIFHINNLKPNFPKDKLTSNGIFSNHT